MAIPNQTMARAIATERAMAGSGLLVKERAVAAGPIIRLNISSTPTTGTVMVEASATTRRKPVSIRPGLTPRASATSGVIEVSSRGR